MIISVGYRVNSKNATSFRRWATSVLKQYLIKGYAINQQIKLDRYNELKDVVRLMSRALRRGRTQAHCRQHTVALTLMIAESRTEEKDVMVKVVVNLINRENQ